jgi:hypothetical protein
MAHQFVVERELAVPVERGWDAMVELIGDELTRVGGEHAFSLDDWYLLERTTEIHAPTRRVYRIVEGAPARSYVGRTEFVPAGGGCVLRWTVVAEKDPGTGDAFDAFFARAEVAITRGADHIVGLTAPGARP